MEREFALIVAGGKGTRFGSAHPKQFMELNGKPIILHTIDAFFRYSDEITVVLVLPEQDQILWEEICDRHHYRKPLIIQTGGLTRFQSVRNGLKLIGDGFVAIHDGVRPLIGTDIIAASFRQARLHQCAVAAVGLKESIRVIADASDYPLATDRPRSKAVDRTKYKLIQTPQTFSTALIKQAYAVQEDTVLTDDASVAERAGFPIHLFEGSYSNIKITTPEDLVVAEAILAHRGGV